MMAGYFRTFKIITANKLLVNSRFTQPNFQPSSLGLKKETKEKYEALNIPAKPKKPQTPFFRYIADCRPQIQKDNPNVKIVDVIKVAAERWKNLPVDDKQKYAQSYNEESVKFHELLEKYQASLTPQQIEVINEVKQEKRKDKKKSKQKKAFKELNRPKRPLGPYPLYLLERSKQLNKSMNVLLKELKGEWANLSENEKEKYRYQYQKEKEKYDKELEAWEMKMIHEDKEDLVRTKTLEEKRPTLKKSKSKVKKSSTEKGTEKPTKSE